MDNKVLISNALEAREMSYSPYSGYAVGAAALGEDGQIYKGANIENSSYGATVCAERNAIFNAVLNGNRHIEAIAVAGGYKDANELTDYAYPCGMCRQVMTEFGHKDMKVLVALSENEYKEFLLDELIPCAFEL